MDGASRPEALPVELGLVAGRRPPCLQRVRQVLPRQFAPQLEGEVALAPATPGGEMLANSASSLPTTIWVTARASALTGVAWRMVA